MITQKVLEVTAHLTEAASFANIKLSPVAASPVARMVDSLRGMNETGSNEELMQQVLAPGTTDRTFDEIENYTAKQIAKILGNVYNTAMNVVNPHCRAIIDQVKEDRLKYGLDKVGLLGTIKQVEIPSLLADKMFQGLIEDYKNSPVQAFPLTDTREIMTVLSDLSAEERRVLILTESNTVDMKIMEMLDEVGFESMVNNALTYGTYDVLNTAVLPLRDAITLFLMLTGVQNSKLDKTNILEDQFKVQIATIRASLGGKIYRDAAQYDDALKDGELIARGNLVARSNKAVSNSSADVLYVNGITYRKWIQEEGGSPEAALGFLSEHGAYYDYTNDKALRKTPARYADIFARKVKGIKDQEILNDVRIVRNTVRQYLTRVINQLEDANKTELFTRMNEALEHPYYGNDYLQHYVIKAVCRTLTEGHDVKNILLEIDTNLKDMAKPDMKNAVFLATVRLVARWVKSQMTIAAKVS